MTAESNPAPPKIAIVTGGGDCPGLNTVIRAIVKAAALRGWESIGIVDSELVQIARALGVSLGDD